VPVPQPVTITIGDGVGTLSVPAVGEVRADAASSRATAIARTVRDAQPSVGCGWVIDLRGTGADADYGAIAGLSAFVPDGQLFSTVGRGGDGQLVTLALATAFVGARPAASVTGPTPRIEQPVAVLQDGKTVGSSEALVLALRRNPDLRTFGARTSGLPTSETFRLSDGALLRLPTTQVMGLDGSVHEDGLEPDVEAEPSAALETATAWVRDACQR
jgi:C-terminal processing protease CtpA/Prc